jgi:hypothetical protein
MIHAANWMYPLGLSENTSIFWCFILIFPILRHSHMGLSRVYPQIHWLILIFHGKKHAINIKLREIPHFRTQRAARTATKLTLFRPEKIGRGSVFWCGLGLFFTTILLNWHELRWSDPWIRLLNEPICGTYPTYPIPSGSHGSKTTHLYPFLNFPSCRPPFIRDFQVQCFIVGGCRMGPPVITSLIYHYPH